MLRHIISVSLAMTACATLIPTKANAATLTVVPIGSLQKNPGDSISFILALNPAGSPDLVRFFAYTFLSDRNELSYRSKTESLPNTPIYVTTTVGTITFDVIAPVKDGNSDLFAVDAYISDGAGNFSTVRSTSVVDVEPVPEPLTIFGTAIGLGCGVVFKRKSLKKKVS
jgi:hypothetical protein